MALGPGSAVQPSRGQAVLNECELPFLSPSPRYGGRWRSAGTPQDASVQDLLSRASRYVEEYEWQLSAVVCEERQTQRVVRRDGTTGKTPDSSRTGSMVRTSDATQTFRTSSPSMRSRSHVKAPSPAR